MKEKDKQPARDPADILAEVQRAAAARQAEKEARYRQLILDTAAGRTDGGRVATELEALGKDPADFAAMVQQVKDRQRLVDQLKAGREAERDLDRVGIELEAAEGEYEEMKRKHEAERLRPLRDEQDRLRDLQSSASDARRELRRTADAELVARAEDLDRQRYREEATVRQKQEAVDSWKRAESVNPDAAKYLARYEPELAEAKRRLAELTRQAAAAEGAAPADGGPPGRWLP